MPITIVNENLLEYIYNLINKSEVDLSRTLIIFPGRRPPHYLRKLMAEKIKQSFIPPHILSIDDFVDTFYEKYIRKDYKITHLDAISILYDIYKKKVENIGKEQLDSLDNFFPMGIHLFDDLEELHIEQINLSAIKDLPYSENIQRSVDTLNSIYQFYKIFYLNLQESKYSTRSTRYKCLAEEIKPSYFDNHDKVIFAGFFTLTKSEKMIFEKLLPSNKTHIIFQQGHGLKKMLQKNGFINYMKYTDNQNTSGNINFYKSPDLHGQVLCLKKMIEDCPNLINEKTAIILPTSDSLFPLLRHGLSSLDEKQYNISIGYPLHRTTLYGLFNKIFDLWIKEHNGYLHVASYLRLVLHPYVKNVFYEKNSSELTRILFHNLEKELSRKNQIFMTLKEIESTLPFETDEQLKHIQDIHKEFILNFEKFTNISDFAEKCIKLVIYIYEKTNAINHPFFYPFCQQFIEELSRLKESLISELSFSNRDSYIQFFKKYITYCRYPFHGTPIGGIQILGMLETRNITFEKVFILDANDEKLPGAPSYSSLIPQGARKHLRLSTYKDKERLIAYYFDCLIRGNKEVHIFFSDSDKDEISRFVEKLIWEREKSDKKVQRNVLIKPIRYKIKLANTTPSEIKKTDEMLKVIKSNSFSPSTLDSYLRCQLSYYFRYVLRLKEMENVQSDLERNVIGTIVHQVLSEYFRGFIGHVITKNKLNLDRVLEILDETFKKQINQSPQGSIYIIKNQISNRLRELFVRHFNKFCDYKPKILSVEEDFEANINGLKIKGRIDMIYQKGDTHCIVDYKTSSDINKYKIKLTDNLSKERDSWEKNITTIQLPFYIMLYSKTKKIDIKKIQAKFFMIGKKEIDEDSFINISGDDFEKYKIQTIINNLIEEILDLNKAFMPPKDFRKSCKFCLFVNFCETMWAV